MKILFQGDSITDGNRYKDKQTRWDKNHQIGHSYAFIVSGELSMLYPMRFEFVNRGISGNRTDELIIRWDEDTIAENPDLLIVLVGTNDVNCSVENFAYDVYGERYYENYRKLLSRARKNNKNLKIVIIEPFAFIEEQEHKETVPCEFKKQKMANVQAKARQIADEFNAVFIPMQQSFNELKNLAPAKYWLWDGIHPTEAGHFHIAKTLIEVLRDMLELKK